MEKLIIEIFGITIEEPVTFLSDIIITIFCFYAGFLLLKHKKNLNININWILFFVFLGISTILGGLAHAFNYIFEKTLHIAAWSTSLFAIFFIELVTIRENISKKFYKTFLILVLIKFLIFLSLTIYYKNFIIVTINTGIGVIFIVSLLNLLRYILNKTFKSKLILYGVVMIVISGFGHIFKISLHKYFNYNVLSHTILLFGLYFIYKSNIYKINEPTIRKSIG